MVASCKAYMAAMLVTMLNFRAALASQRAARAASGRDFTLDQKHLHA